ncbi:DUF559 domain-containing protein [Planktothrix agardhii]|uniref:DUF559 domain-containing protein n=1 Tax=Planktothrix agardhii TaxID=1160 RepID=UPI0039B0E133
MEAGIAWLEDFPAFVEQVLEWLPEDLQTPPETLEVALPDYSETLRPTYVVADPDSKNWVLLIQTVKPGLLLDEINSEAQTGQGWKASIQAKFERLLRETEIPIGLLCNGMEIRLVYAPRGESSGHLTFPVQAMTEVPGRLILAALEMLIGNDRFFNVPSDRRLPKILSDSRNYQAEVSTQLASQVLDALWELLRGFQSADAAVEGKLLRELAETDSQHIYGGLITTLMRLVFLLYAEDEGLMPDDAIYQRNYAISGLYEKLREDAGLYPDTMDQRYGAWATLLSLFRLVYDGGGATQEYLPARHGQLFDPDEFPFLEGRPRDTRFQTYGEIKVPRIPDGIIYRILDKLLILKGERLSYRALDVEQIGSVYEAIMGYEVEVALGLSIAVKPKDVVVNVEALLNTKAKDRAKQLQDEAECKLTGKASTTLKEAKTPEEIVAALDRKVSSRTPNLLPQGSLYLQPGEERRRTGSHYTPRKLTQPIVETTLRPVLESLGEHPTAEQILGLKVCDLAMGSAAFLVEVCRQLAEKLVAAWDYHGNMGEYFALTPSALSPNSSPMLGEGDKNTPAPFSQFGNMTLSPNPSPMLGEGDKKTPAPPAPFSQFGRRAGDEGQTLTTAEGETNRWEVPQALRQKMIEIARDFRKTPTRSEDILWQALRGRKLDGRKFRRQQPIGNFIVDFFCASERLIVEVDGGIHNTQQELDRQRQELLESLGLRFVRVSSEMVENNLPAALNAIQAGFLALSPNPSPMLGEGDKNTPAPPAPFSQTGGRAGDGGQSAIEPLLLARRLVAQRCLYGVDKNPFAVNLAKLSLWLVTLAKDMPFTFVDHALKCGDSLVGLTQQEIGDFVKDPISDLPLMKLLQEQVGRAKSLRSQIQALDTRSDTDTENKLTQLQRADHELEDLRLVGDIAIAAFFDSVGKSKKDSQELQESYKSTVRAWRQGKYNPDAENSPRLQSISESLRNQGKGIMPFNWEVEFPEVFDRQNSGFDAIIGNPPFLGGKKVSTNFGDAYKEWLLIVNPEFHGNSDIVSHFFRRAFTIIRKQGTLGLIATNTIAQGDTRSSGLRFICNNGGTIYNAQKRVKWPGLAAVIISVINIIKGEYAQPKNLNGRLEDKITAFLFPKGGNEDPKILLANANKSFQGSIVLGTGFTFDDTNSEATSIEEMHRLIEKDPRNTERIFPYIGGEEVNKSPTHSHYRYIINFGEMSEDEARQWPDLMEIVKEKVKPQRDKIIERGKQIHEYDYWKFWDKRTETYKAIAKLDRVLVSNCGASKHISFSFQPSRMVFANTLAIFSFEEYSTFAILQSTIHEIWARFFGSSLEDRLRYTPSDCFETFPFPLIPDPSPTREAGSQKIDISPASILEEENSQKTNISPSPKLGEKPGERVVEVSPPSPTLPPVWEKGAGVELSPSPSMGEGLGERVFGSSPPSPTLPPDWEKGAGVELSPSPSMGEGLGERVVEVSPPSPTLPPVWEKGAGVFLSPSPSMGEGLGVRETLETIGKEYYEYRAQLMLRNNQGLTDTYNRFHNPQENHPDILKLRQLHTQMDLAVLKAYGWEDLDTTCGFALDYLDLDEDNDIPPEAQDRIASGDYFFPTAEEAMHFESLISTGKRKLPWRYRWCETTHDEVLARLLDLNQSRYEEEILGGKTKTNNSRSRGHPKSKGKSSANTPTIPGIL